MKKLTSLLLVLAVLLTMAVPAAAFSDVTDTTVRKEVAVLQMMGVINGTSSEKFSPNGTLTRAQFCKMAVILLGRGEEEPLYRARTIFPDVRSAHWARGYINLAVNITMGADNEGKNGTPLIRGMAGGTFQPDRAITYAESVTILMRMLSYTDADAGMSWPKGYLELAGKIGLTTGMNLSANQSLTRAQAAHLFATVLNTPQKGGSAYYNKLGTAQADVVLMNANATAEDGTPGAMGTSAGVFKPVSGSVPAELVGSRGTLVTNAAGKAVAFVPVGTQKTVVVGTAQAGWVTNQTGTKFTIPSTVPAYTTTQTSTYDKLWMDLRGGSQITLFYSSAGKVESVYISTATSDSAVVARQSSGNPFAALVDGVSTYTIYRDGSAATLGDISLYDVGTYDAAARVLSVSSTKLTGRYDNVWPNLQSPSKITVLGATLNVLPMAMDEVAAFKLGDTITLLLTSDGQVAGAVATSVARGDNIGVVTKNDGSEVTAKILNGPEVTGLSTNNSVKPGELAYVSSGGVGKLSLSRVSSSSVSGTFTVADRKVGSLSLSGSCQFFEKVGQSAMKQIFLTDLTLSAVPNSKILYAHQNSSGKVDVLIFNDATGDLYTYGMLSNGEPQTGGSGDLSYSNPTIVVTNSDNPKGAAPLVSAASFTRNSMGGVAAKADGSGAAGVVTLTAENNIKRSAFQTRDDVVYVTLSTQEMRVADNVQCYNKTTGTWFKSLADARAFSDRLTVYYDRPVQDGGKVRVVVAE